MVLQVAKVHKTLISVAKLEAAGNTVVFGSKSDSYIENNISGERVYMRKRGGLYEIDVWVRPFSQAGPIEKSHAAKIA